MFRVGDKVVVTRDIDWDEVSFEEGQTGTIKKIRDWETDWKYAVEWDFENEEFHTCDNSCKFDRGYWVAEHFIKQIWSKKNNFEWK